MPSQQLLNTLAELPAYLLPPSAASRLAGVLYLLCYRLVGRSSLTSTARAVELCLAEPPIRAREIARASFAAKGKQRSNYRSMAKRSRWRLAQPRFSASTHRALADAASPLVILTLHQADYLAGLLTALSFIPLDREIHIIKLAEWTRIEEDAYAHFRQYGHTLVIHRLSEKPAKKIVRALKNNAILVTFVDVPREFGATTDVSLFGLPFQITSGPLVLARLARASVLPLFSNYVVASNSHDLHLCSDLNLCEVRAGSMIEGKESLSVAVMAQYLAEQIEGNLRRFAHQWEMWPVIANLLDHERLSNGDLTLSPSALARLRIAGAKPQSQQPTI